LFALVERDGPRNTRIKISNERVRARGLNRSITLSIIDESSCAKRVFRAFIVRFRRASNIGHAVPRILPRTLAAGTRHLMRSRARIGNAPFKQALVT
jgi:hypothetical protein